MKEWVLKYWVGVLFGFLTGSIIAVYKKLSGNMTAKFREQEAVKLGVQALLRDRIVQSYNYYMEKEHCPIYAMDNINALYIQYHALGGNGTITELVERLREMPTEKKIKIKEEN
jgi:UDP-glucose 6-dehydrogenase